MTALPDSIREPIAEIELEMPPDGDGSFGATMQVAGDPAALYAKTSEWDGWSWAWVRWRAPDVAAVGLLIVLPLLLRMMWKARRRGRRGGHVYCAVCDHELVKPQIEVVDADHACWLGGASRCPECGSRKEPVIAGTYLKRTKWRILACVFVLGLSGCTWALTLTGRTAALQSVSHLAAWPDWRLPSAWPEWPLYRSTPAEEMRSRAIWRVGLDGAVPRRILQGSAVLAEPFVSESGRLAALGSSGKLGAIVVLDRKSGMIREFAIPSEREMEAMVAGFGLGDRSVLVALVAVAIEPTRIEFWKVGVESGAMNRVDLIDVPNQELPMMQFIPPLAVEDDRGVRWAFVGSTNRSDQQYRYFAFVGGADGWRRYDLDQATPLTMARISPDLNGVRFQWDPSDKGGDTSRSIWEFESGMIEERLLEVRRRAVRLVPGQSGVPGASKTAAASDMQVVDEHTGERSLTLAKSAGLGSNWFASADGRIVAGVVTRTETGWMRKWVRDWPPVQSARLLVWDLGEVKR